MKLILSDSQAETLKTLLECPETDALLMKEEIAITNLDRIYENLTNPDDQLEY